MKAVSIGIVRKGNFFHKAQLDKDKLNKKVFKRRSKDWLRKPIQQFMIIVDDHPSFLLYDYHLRKRILLNSTQQQRYPPEVAYLNPSIFGLVFPNYNSSVDQLNIFQVNTFKMVLNWAKKLSIEKIENKLEIEFESPKQFLKQIDKLRNFKESGLKFL